MSNIEIPKYSRVLVHDGEAWNVTVPELNNSTTFGDSPEHALEMAQEMIEGYVEVLVKHGEPIPPAYEGLIPFPGYDLGYDPSKPVMTVGDWRNSGLIGMWADRTDITDSVEFARSLRENANNRNSNDG